MISSCFLPSTQFLSSNPRLSVHSKPINFRQTHLISASCATVERSSVSFYEVLGIQSGATCQEIKKAYRRLARVVHPDVATGGGNGGSAADEFMRIHAAYSTLSDPDKRADYDSSLFVTGMRGFSVGSYGGVQTGSRFSGGAPRRNWETDQCW